MRAQLIALILFLTGSIFLLSQHIVEIHHTIVGGVYVTRITSTDPLNLWNTTYDYPFYVSNHQSIWPILLFRCDVDYVWSSTFSPLQCRLPFQWIDPSDDTLIDQRLTRLMVLPYEKCINLDIVHPEDIESEIQRHFTEFNSFKRHFDRFDELTDIMDSPYMRYLRQMIAEKKSQLERQLNGSTPVHLECFRDVEWSLSSLGLQNLEHVRRGVVHEWLWNGAPCASQPLTDDQDHQTVVDLDQLLFGDALWPWQSFAEAILSGPPHDLSRHVDLDEFDSDPLYASKLRNISYARTARLILSEKERACLGELEYRIHREWFKAVNEDLKGLVDLLDRLAKAKSLL